MMNYEVFKVVIAERIKDFLPPVFQNYKVTTTVVRKVNEEKDTLLIMPQGENGIVTMPNIYLDDMYEEFRLNQDMDQILEVIAAMVVHYTGSFSPETVKLELKDKKDAIVMNLINTNQNRELLREIPHREIMDLSIIYRIIMQQTDHGLMTILVDNKLMEELGLTQEELDELAHNNTRRMFPIEIMEMADFFYVVTNSQRIYGAATMVYEDAMDKVAEKIGDNFFVIPSSIHEWMAVPEKDMNANILNMMLKDANLSVCEKNEVLADVIYYYDRAKKELTIAV